MTRVHLATHLRSYTDGAAEIVAEGATLGAVVDDVESRHRGWKVRVVDEQDRIRPHIKFFVDGEQVFGLDGPAGSDVYVLAALSGG